MAKCKNFIIKHKYIFTLISALLSALPHSFGKISFISFFSFFPFFIIMVKNEKKLFEYIKLGFLFGFVYHIGVYYWFLAMYPLSSIGMSKGETITVVLAGWLGISFIHGLIFSLPAFFLYFFKKYLTRSVYSCTFFLCIMFVLSEKLMEWGELGFPWVRISLGMAEYPVFIQSLSIFGSLGLDLLVLFINGLICIAFCAENKKRTLCFCSAVLLFVVNLFYGIICLMTEPQKNKSFTVSVLQGGILSGENLTVDGAYDCFEKYCELNDKAIKDYSTDLIIWPESSVLFNTDLSKACWETSILYEHSKNIPIIVGMVSLSEGKTYNTAAYLYNGNYQTYYKQHLVPFGEYLPYRDFFEKILPSVNQIKQITSDIEKGNSPGILNTQYGKIAPIICFESIFGNICKDSINNGGELLLVLTNDSWYKDSVAVRQHVLQGVFRGVENGRCVIQAANTGESAFIDSKGRIIKTLGALEEGILNCDVYTSNSKTVYGYIGDTWLYILTACFLGITFLKIKMKKTTD